MEVLRPNKERAKNAILLIWAVLILNIFVAMSDYNIYVILKEIISGGDVQESWIATSESLLRITNMLFLVVYIASGVGFIMWFRRAYYNLNLCTKTTYTDGWAAGAWFVPFINLVRPMSIMKELYNSTNFILSQRGINNPNLNTKFLGWWWALWLINNIVTGITSRIYSRTEDIDTMMTIHLIDALMIIPFIALTIITVRVIKDYASAEEQLFRVKNEISNVETIKPHQEI